MAPKRCIHYNFFLKTIEEFSVYTLLTSIIRVWSLSPSSTSPLRKFMSTTLLFLPNRVLFFVLKLFLNSLFTFSQLPFSSLSLKLQILYEWEEYFWGFYLSSSTYLKVPLMSTLLISHLFHVLYFSKTR